jgi:HSP20 family protein
VIAERITGTFTRQVVLGRTLDSGRIEAHYDDGVLTVAIPVAEQAKPRRIEVSNGSSEKTESASHKKLFARKPDTQGVTAPQSG